MMVSLTQFDDVLRPIVSGRRIICVGATVASLVPTATTVRRLGATDVLILSMEGYGIGDPVAPELARVINHDLAVTGPSMVIMRAEEDFKANLPGEISAQLDEFDPDRTSLVLGQFVNTVSHLDGRAFLAYRRPEWLNFEDKTIIDGFWDRAGVVRTPSIVTRPTVVALTQARHDLDVGSGVVVSGDAKEGFNGGAEYVRWIRSDQDIAPAHTFFSEHCDNVRVMQFLEGIPCSIHGIVFPEYVAALRPVEMVVLRRMNPAPSENVFAYSGCASFYDPPEEIRVQMIELAKRAGAQLRSEINFRGCFTVDGVVTKDGFRPTELNPRQGAGISALFGSYPAVPFGLVFDAIAADRAEGIQPDELEALLRKLADDRRGGGTWRTVTVEVVDTNKRGAVLDGEGEWRWANPGETPWITITSGPRGAQGSVRGVLNDAVVPIGASVGSLACSFWNFADHELHAGVGKLTPAIPAVQI
jgi:hypothetical protein